MFGVPERRLRDCRDSSYFLRFAKNVTSQGGEDGILKELFSLIGTTATPYCIDIGAWDGQHLSNTYQLVHSWNWGGLLVEANSERHEQLCALYSTRPDVTCIDCLVDIDGESALSFILQKHNVPLDLDFVSIDVDGADYHLWESIGNTYKPRVMCIEFNPTIPNHVHYVQERDITVQEGSSLLALAELGRSFGYHLVVTTTFNAIFVRQDLLHLLPPNIFTYLPVPGTSKLEIFDAHAQNSSTEYSIQRTVDLNSMHNCSMATDIFQTYSGELKLCGPKKLMWHRVSMNIQQMQAIKPKKDRVFPFAPPYTKTITSLENTMSTIVTLISRVARTPATSASTSQHTELDNELQSLLTQSASVFGLAENSEDGKKSTATLRDICKEIHLNALSMCLVLFRDTVVKHTSSVDGLLQVLYSFLGASAVQFEQIGDQLEAASSGSTNVAVLNDAKGWFERALHVSTFLIDQSQNTDKRAELVSSIHRLSCKLSANALLRMPPPAWVKSFREPHSSTSGDGAGSTGMVQSSAEDVDEMLRGLFWKQLACSTATSVPQLSVDQNVDTTEASHLAKLDKKWRSKVMWAESEGDVLKDSVFHKLIGAEPAPTLK
eukprot:gene13992-16088_t